MYTYLRITIFSIGKVYPSTESARYLAPARTNAPPQLLGHFRFFRNTPEIRHKIRRSFGSNYLLLEAAQKGMRDAQQNGTRKQRYIFTQ